MRTWLELPVARIANFSPVIVSDLSPATLRALFATHRHERFPVVVDRQLIGVLSRRTAEAALAAGLAPPLEPAAHCTAETPLREVQTRIINSTSQFAVVLDHEGPEGRVVGLLTLHDILRAEMLFAREQEA
ncbi:MAG: hypothetical protein CFE26_24915 [Verrucomicrobiales bacterium VVV1]|nr:MAG: hypothetical protein CFE26_24915 [Verrucomicrobiales bacterium VVV1]